MKNFLVAGCLLVLVSGLLFSDPPSWPQWRGPNGNGVSPEADWDPNCLGGGAGVLWTADIGAGYSNVVIEAGRLYAVGSGDRCMVVQSRDAATGEAKWRKEVETGSGWQDPESTPAIDQDNLYVLAKNGTLLCLHAADASEAWRITVGFGETAQVKTGMMGFGFATSPIVGGGLLLLNVNLSGVALDKETGKVVWESGIAWDRSVYSSPVLFDQDGTRAAVFTGPKSLSVVAIDTGRVLWSVPHPGRGDIEADPVPVAGGLFFTALHGCLVQAPGGAPRVRWTGDSLRGSVSTPVPLGGYLYGTDWNRTVGNWDWHPIQREPWPFKCVEAATGKVAWTRSMPWVSQAAAGGKLLLLDANGILTIARVDELGMEVISSADVLAGAHRPRLFPTPPVLCDGRIYVRNYAGDLICIDARK
ncbi:MAG TPA: PQQ-binding-like beta-propeller repeat protein [Spirochaetia bacterium]|nr:PQQ-binding-like beta-propeller repeat protein [Spirochaetia bacterium]